jgi:hypothetical protein
MAAKKNTRHTTLRKTPTRRRSQSVENENRATDMPRPTAAVHADARPEPIGPLAPAEDAEALAEPTAESSGVAMLLAFQEAPMATMEGTAEAAAPADKLSALDAAAKVLGESGQPLSCPELITAMAAKGYWNSPKGRTPAATLYSALLRERQTKGEQGRFVKVGRGKFALRAAL